LEEDDEASEADFEELQVDSGNSDLEVVEIKQPTVKRSFSRGISFASLGVVYSVYIFSQLIVV
jgi:hypothetical protein